MVAIFADANRARMRLIEETQWGVLPGSGTTREIRFTGSTLNAQKDTTSSEEIRSDRMISTYVETAARAQGDINVEFSAGSHDELMEAFMYGAWTRPMTFDSFKGTAVSWGATSKVYIAGADNSAYFTAGRRIKTEGFENPVNNGYFQVSSVTYNSGSARTEVTVTTTTSVIEAGSAYTKLFDANDVIVLKDTHIRSGTAGDSTFDSNSNNSFSAAVTAGQLVAGQKIFVEGLGFETGTVVVVAPGTSLVAAGATLAVFDGVKTLTLQFGGTLLAGNVAVVADGSDEDVTAANIAAAINHQRVLGNIAVNATAATATVTLKNLNSDGGSITANGDTNSAFTVTDFSGGDATARGIFTIVSATADVLTVTPQPPTINNSTLGITVKGSMLRNPTSANIVPQSYSFETAFEDINQYFVTSGHRISTVAYTIGSGSIITGTYGLMGRGMDRYTATKLGSGSYTPLVAPTAPVASATLNVGQVYSNGAALTTAIKTISVNGTNNLREQMAIGNKFPVGIGAGRIEFTGSVEAYFADGSLWDHFIDHDTVSLNWSIADNDKNHYEFTVPAAIFATDNANPSGGNSDVMETVDWSAFRDPITNCEFQIDRFSATAAV